MSTIKVVSMTGAEVGTVELNDAIFGVEPNMSVVHEVVKNHLANCRQGTQSALTRAEVSGGGRKPWRQKGTGRARQGSTRSPQWTHGGIAFAPKPRTYSYVLNKKVKRLALKSVLSSKAKDGEIVVVDKIAMDEIKTKSFKNFLTAVNAEGKSVVVTPEVNDIVVKSARNIPGVVTSPAKLINVYDLLNAKTLVIDKDALAVIEEVFAYWLTFTISSFVRSLPNAPWPPSQTRSMSSRSPRMPARSRSRTRSSRSSASRSPRSTRSTFPARPSAWARAVPVPPAAGRRLTSS